MIVVVFIMCILAMCFLLASIEDSPASIFAVFFAILATIISMEINHISKKELVSQGVARYVIDERNGKVSFVFLYRDNNTSPVVYEKSQD